MTLEVYEEVEINGIKGQYAEIYGTSILSFQKEGIWITISGDLKRDELIEIAKSI